MPKIKTLVYFESSRKEPGSSTPCQDSRKEFRGEPPMTDPLRGLENAPMPGLI